MFVLSAYLLGLAALIAMMTVVWVLSLMRQDAGIVDLFWSLAFMLALITYTAVTSAPLGSRTAVLIAIVSIWGLRLSGFLTWRNWGQPEDYRYQAMRRRGGPRWHIQALFTIFWGQAILAWVISAPLLAGVDSTRDLGWLDFVGLAFWLIGFFFESVGDWQLSAFKRDPNNVDRVMDTGLWRLTRHPNYFGDFMVWWGFFLVAASAGGWWSIFGPIVMSFMLMRVSGVTLLEKKLAKSRTGYGDYIRTTNTFFPGPKKSQ